MKPRSLCFVLSGSPLLIALQLPNPRKLYSGEVVDLLVQIRLESKREKNLEMHEEGCQDQGCQVGSR